MVGEEHAVGEDARLMKKEGEKERKRCFVLIFVTFLFFNFVSLSPFSLFLSQQRKLPVLVIHSLVLRHHVPTPYKLPLCRQ